MTQWKKEALTYCSNVHPGADYLSLINNIGDWINPVRKRRELKQMAAGLWFSNQCAQTLSSSKEKKQQLKNTLDENGLVLSTINGFPYGDFHQKKVKQKVYLPTWAESTRVDYTLKLAQLFNDLLPPGAEIAPISTLPLGYAKKWSAEQHNEAAKNLCQVASNLEKLENKTGKHILLCLEMEPDCALENTEQLITFFSEDLQLTAKKLGIDSGVIYRYLGCCYDTCHQAVMHEDVKQSLRAINQAEIRIGKIQVSNAPAAFIQNRNDLETLIHQFNEPKFLHQVKVLTKEGNVCRFGDLGPEILTQCDENLFHCPWHIHYHVPINVHSFTQLGLKTTQSKLQDVFQFLQQTPSCRPILEVETYTWLQYAKRETPVGSHDKFDLIQGITDELAWLESQLTQHQLLLQ